MKNNSTHTLTPAQEYAVSHTGSDLLISAGAGSGKTATLTERIIRRIIDENKDISRMLVVTFTKSASNELKARISKKVSEALRLQPSSHHLSSQLVKLSSADISTIHGFCLKVIRPHFDKLGLDADFRIGDENEILIIKNEVMRQVIDSFYEAEDSCQNFLLVADCYSEFNNENALGDELLSLYNKLSSTSYGIELLNMGVGYDGDFIKTEYGKVILNSLNELISHYAPIYRKYIELIKEENDPKGVAKFLPALSYDLDFMDRLSKNLLFSTYTELCEIFNTYKPLSIGSHKYAGELDKDMISSVKGRFKEDICDIRDKFFYANEELIGAVINQNDRILKAVYSVLSVFETEFKKRKSALSLCDFNDLERMTYSLFYDKNGDITQLARDTAERYDELYIDEYQDVNSLQDMIFRAISRNNRFMVGDIKQSIYRFRSAEPEIFSDYRDTFLPIDLPSLASDEYRKSLIKFDDGKAVFMSNNFRCDKHIISFTNAVSRFMFKHSHGFTYSDSDALIYSKKQEEGYRHEECEIALIGESAVEDGQDIKDAQADYVARKIRELIDTGFLPSGEKIEKKHIAILLRSVTGRSQRYISALKRYNISSEYIQDSSFFEKPHILLLMCILNAIDNPDRDVYFAGALRSDVFGFSLEELSKIRRSTPKELSFYKAFASYSGNGALSKRICAVLEKLDALRENVNKMPSHEAVSYVLTETGFLSMCRPDERRDMLRFYDYARQYEKSSYKGLCSFLRYCEDVSERKSKESVCNGGDNNVKIMSVHSAKGLEFEICFLADCEKKFNFLDSQAPMLYHKSLGIASYVSRENGLVKYNNILRKCIALSLKRSTIEEEMRTLYVALTRAKSKLYITASLNDPQKAIEASTTQVKFADDYEIYSKDSYIEYILGACASPREDFSIKIIKKEENDDIKNTDCDSAEIVSAMSRERMKEILTERFEFEYPYAKTAALPSKMSISSLYPGVLDEDEGSTDIDISLELYPDFALEGDKEISAAMKGTATHVFMQFCDFNRLISEGGAAELERLVSLSFISPEVSRLINLSHIELFRKSELLSQIMNAKHIWREFRFNVLLSAEELSYDKELSDEKVLVQGVIDLVFENENGELFLVDYKTDNVNEKNYISVLKERHTSQLSYYRRACEMMFERPVSKTLLYSVSLAKCVEI